jgi:CrcB protein
MNWVETLGAVARHPITAVTLGSALGGNARYWLGLLIAAHTQHWRWGLPWGTMVINVTGSFLLGLFAVVFRRDDPTEQALLLLLGTGFCGGYTTFSTFELDTFRSLREGNWPAALANVVGSVAAGFLGLLLGVGLARLVFERQ